MHQSQNNGNALEMIIQKGEGMIKKNVSTGTYHHRCWRSANDITVYNKMCLVQLVRLENLPIPAYQTEGNEIPPSLLGDNSFSL